MSFEINKDSAYVFYVNFSATGLQDGSVKCEAEQNFSFSSLISNAGNYVLSIERFRVPLQTIPMLNAVPNAIVLRSKTAAPDLIFNSERSFSLYEWMLQVNNAFGADLLLALTADGRFEIVDFDFNAFSIELSPTVSDIFDMEQKVDSAGVQSVTGSSVGFDRFDQLFKLNFEALNGLTQLQQEIIDADVFTTLITDFLIPSSFNLSNSNTLRLAPNGQLNFDFQVREDVEFNATANRRLQMFRGQSPIQNLKVRVVAIYRDGSRNEITLPPRGVFNLKLAFWKK